MRPPPRVDYDLVAPVYERRYETTEYDGVRECLENFLEDIGGGTIAEIGCGTGHWLAFARSVAPRSLVIGLDLSAAMLAHASAGAPVASLVRGTARELPFAAASVDRVVCINALHHFPDRDAFFRDCHRVLRPAGRLLTIGLDPHTSHDRWWIYEYFPSSLAANRSRYAATATIIAELHAAGFRDVETSVAQHLPARLSFADAEAQGFLDRRSTSQLMVLSDDEWTAGLARLQRDRPELFSDLRLYATVATRA